MYDHGYSGDGGPLWGNYSITLNVINVNDAPIITANYGVCSGLGSHHKCFLLDVGRLLSGFG